MKKYLAIGITTVAVVAILMFLSWEQGSAHDKPLAIYGTAKAGTTVTACLDGMMPCFSAIAQPNNMYYIRGNLPHGQYTFWNACCPVSVLYFGKPVRVDFSISGPPMPCC